MNKQAKYVPKEDQKRNRALSREFLLSRGYCCKSNCTNCPYGITKKDPSIPEELDMNKNYCEDDELAQEYLDKYCQE